MLVIRVEFNDALFTLSTAALQAQMDKVRQYHLENSYGLVTASFTMTRIYHLNAAKASYAAHDYTDPVVDAGAGNIQLVNDLVDNSTGPVNVEYDFSQFNHMMFLVAGMGQETSGNTNDFWSMYVPLTGDQPKDTAACGSSGGFGIDGQCFDGATWIPEKEAVINSVQVSPIGVIAHEYGHQIGAVDLYDTSVPGGSSVIGDWSVYDDGTYAGNPLGSNPSLMDAWTKVFLGYVTPTVIGGGSSAVALAPVERNRVIYKVPVGGSDVGSLEYYLIEYRSTSSGAQFDQSEPGSGLMIWHIDDSRGSLTDNSVNVGSRPRVHVMRASHNASPNPNAGLSGDGDASDPYPGASNVTSFNGLNWNGASSQVSAASIADVGGGTITTTLTPRAAGASPTTPPVHPALSASVSFSNVTLDLPANAFSDSVNLTVSLPASLPFPASAAGSLSSTGLGIDITTDKDLQPLKPLTLTMTYADSDVTGKNQSQLLLARYDPAAGLWVPQTSTPDPAHHRVSAALTHLSLYQLMSYGPSASFDAAKAFPNPVFSSQGQQMTFVNLPAGTSVTLYTLTGRKIRELTANASGMAQWDARNIAGAPVASGVYLALLDDGNGGKKVMKVMVER